jgi:glutaconate CoA-transferase subunit A
LKLGKPFEDKIKSLKEAAKLINSGDTITFSGMSTKSHPVALAHEIIRQRKRNLEIAGSAAWVANNLLIGAGCVDRLLLIGVEFVEYGGLLPTLRRGVEGGKIIVDDYSYYAFACRLMAAAIGIPFFPTKSMLGSDMLRYSWLEGKKKFHVMKCPFTGEKIVLVPALEPDAAVIHAPWADTEGNVQLLGPTDLIDEQARASKKVIVTVEKIVSEASIRKRPDLTILPSFLVDAIVKVPFGAHPTAVTGIYGFDREHWRYVFEQSKDEQKLNKYLADFVYGVESHSSYLDLIGGRDKLQKLSANSDA